MPRDVHVIDHPLVHHKLTLLRQKELSTNSFRNLVAEIIAAPLLATGNSAAAAIDRIKHAQPRSIKLVCLVVAPEGVATLQ
jgi:uracil phosphoribosyltransferase